MSPMPDNPVVNPQLAPVLTVAGLVTLGDYPFFVLSINYLAKNFTLFIAPIKFTETQSIKIFSSPHKILPIRKPKSDFKATYGE